MAGGPVRVRCGIGVNTDSKFLIGRVARIVMKAENWVSNPEWAFWHEPEVDYHRHLNKKNCEQPFVW